MDFLACIAKLSCEHKLYLRMYVLYAVFYDELAAFGKAIYVFQLLQKHFQFGTCKEVDAFEHCNVCHGTEHIVWRKKYIKFAVFANSELFNFLV